MIPQDTIPEGAELDAQLTAYVSEFFARKFGGEGEGDVFIDLMKTAILAERQRCAAVIRAKADQSKALWDEFIASGRDGPASSSHPAYYDWADEIMNGISAPKGGEA
ncbi:hypothetical protein [Aliirhizobium cellulosilyticum]|uniref:Uncharacterized protein n=1 Tax=Aliirhizobium cellulosilyticum TaxID=393664 RepID=A0A7W6T9V9_9HYPH|nr:hypothetical protein [Rhizobium cellulosilyticum]MBB4347969.1 hypothetical protein [Rhizobium cellulosilyticum]MBB4409637.1 hypothetical protein [Rhizobium cellulosilyticum]MBB4444325.1 hypothetical protein [Rhizobium cellulosilyticum]